MQGIYFQSRANWREEAHALGFDVALLDNPAYWVEAIPQPFCLQFSVAEIKAIAKATEEINQLALDMVAHVCTAPNSDELMEKLLVPQAFRKAIRLSWQRLDRSLYGRLDLAVSGNGIKLFELNFDTPTGLPESAVLQMAWYQAMCDSGEFKIRKIEQSDQFNFIQDNLLEALNPSLWSQVSSSSDALVHFGYYRHAKEDAETVKYLYGCSQLAGLQSKLIVINDLKRTAAAGKSIADTDDARLCDLDGLAVQTLFKLYPWEQIFIDEERLHKNGKSLFLPLLLSNQTAFIEPAWKSLLGSKACLALLWQMYPNHPLLLETYFEDDGAAVELCQRPHVRKAIFGREGANIEIVFPDDGSNSEKSGGEFSDRGFIVQAYEAMPKFEDFNLLVGSWIVNHRAVGIGIRADQSKITGRKALFVPHFVA